MNPNSGEFGYSRLSSFGVMTAIIPKSNDWLVSVVVISHDAEGGGAEKEVPPRGWFQAQPARGEHVQKVTMSEYQHLVVDGADSVDDSIRPHRYIRDSLATWTAIAKNIPTGALPIYLRGRHAFVVAIVPFNKIVIDARDRTETGQFTGPRCPSQRAGQYLSEEHTDETLVKPPRIALAVLGQR